MIQYYKKDKHIYLDISIVNIYSKCINMFIIKVMYQLNIQ